MSKPKIVTFDVYMALLDIEGSLVPVIADELNMKAPAATSFVRAWRAKQMERAALGNSLNIGHMSFRTITGMALEYVAGQNAIEISHPTREALIEAWDKLNPWPEADEVVGAIKAKGFMTAILSNGDQAMLEAVARNFASGFDHILSAETAGKYKPHPAVYDLPTTVLGIDKTDVLHIAGSANDVMGAVAAGMGCIWSNRHGDALLDPSYQPTATISDLAGLPALV